MLQVCYIFSSPAAAAILKWQKKRSRALEQPDVLCESSPRYIDQGEGTKNAGPPGPWNDLDESCRKGHRPNHFFRFQKLPTSNFQRDFGLWNLRIMDFLSSWLPFFNAPRKNWCLGFFFIENRRWPWPEDPLRAISLQLHKGRSLGKGVALKGATKKHVHMPSFGSCSWDEKAWNFQPLLGF